MNQSMLRLNAGRVIHAIRKFHGYGQIELAKEFRFSQSNVSKVESGILELDLFFWLELTRTLHVKDPYCFYYGTAEIEGIPKLGKVDKSFYKRVGFKIPKHYLSDPLITSRKVRPLIEVFERILAKPWNTFLKESKIPRVMFDILNFPIPSFLVKDLADFTHKHAAKLDWVKDLNLTSQKNHGLMFQDYASASTTFNVLKHFIHKQREYGIDHEYLIAEENGHESIVHVHASPELLKVFSKKDLETNKFLNFSAEYPRHLMKMKNQNAGTRLVLKAL